MSINTCYDKAITNIKTMPKQHKINYTIKNNKRGISECGVCFENKQKYKLLLCQHTSCKSCLCGVTICPLCKQTT